MNKELIALWLIGVYLHKGLKWNVNVISSDLPLIKWNFRFTAVPLKALSNQECM